MTRILVIFPGALGDLICLVPALWAIRRSNPDAAIDLMARGELATMAVDRLGIDRGLSIDRREVAELFAAEDEGGGANRLFAGYHRIFSFFGAENLLYRARLSAASHDAEVSFHPFRPTGAGHIAIAHLNSIGLPTEPFDTRIRLLDVDLDAADGLLDRLGLRTRNFTLIFPGSGGPAKNWPLDNFLMLARRIRSRTTPLFILGPAEAGFGERMRPAGFPVLADLELPIVAALAARALLFVGNDSGLSHLAAAAGAPGIVIFGPSDPAQFRPLGDIEAISRMPLETLSVDELATAVDARLAALA
jgi:heptosyltransferase-3